MKANLESQIEQSKKKVHTKYIRTHKHLNWQSVKIDTFPISEDEINKN